MTNVSSTDFEMLTAGLNALRESVFIFDPQTGTPLFWNKAFRDISGYSDKEIARNMAPYSYYSPTDLERAAEKTAKVSSGESVIFEMDLITKSGSRIPTEYSVTSIVGPIGVPRLIIAIGQQTSMANRSENPLDERLRFETLVTELSARLVGASAQELNPTVDTSLAKIAEFFGAGRVVLIQLSEEGERFKISHAYADTRSSPIPVGADVTDLFGPASTILGRGEVLQFASIDELPEEVQSMRDYYVQQGIRSTIAIPLKISDRIIGSLSLAVFDRERTWKPELVKRLRLFGEIIASAIMRNRTELALRESEAKSRAVLQAIPDLMFYLSEEGIHLDFHAPAKDKLLVRPEEFLGKSVEEVLPSPVGRKYMRHIRRTLDSQKMQLFEYTLTFPQDEERIYEARMIPSDENKVLAIIREVTELRRLETRLRQAGKMEAIGQMAGGIAHDFNNMLSGIIGFAEMLQEVVPEQGKAQQYTGQIIKGGLRARDLVRQILTFSRQDDEQLRPISLSKLLREVLEFLAASVPSTVVISPEIEESIPLVLADSTKIHESLLNLVNNAVQAMNEDGELHLCLKEEAFSEASQALLGPIEPGNYVVLEVRDTGSGMDHHTLERIFDPFFTTKPKDQGTGMGLAVVYGVMKSHFGNIRVKSEVGSGTLFELIFPAVKTDLQDQPRRKKEPLPRGTERILIVDDDEVVRNVTTDILLSLGYLAESCHNPREALSKLQEEPLAYHLLITDQTMPGITGVELAIQARSISPRLPIVLCTGFSKKVDKSLVRELGASRLCMKPLRRRELARVVREILDGRPAEQNNSKE